ncbi:MAG: zinc ribbon domain-containing protein [Candidatus Heimdallarchaeota archaeon]
MAIVDYIGKTIALPDGTKIGSIKDIERQPVTQRFFAIIALNPPHKGKTIKIPVGELRKVSDNAFGISPRFAEGVKKELFGETEAVEIKPAQKPPPSDSSPSPQQAPSPTLIGLKDAKVWSEISQQISGKKHPSERPPATSTAPKQELPSRTPPSAPTPPPPTTLPKELKCPKCKKTVQSDFKFCPHCRSPLFCINCLYPILDRKWKSCPQCGFIFPKK